MRWKNTLKFKELNSEILTASKLRAWKNEKDLSCIFVIKTQLHPYLAPPSLSHQN